MSKHQPLNERESRLLEALRERPELLSRFESILALTRAQSEGRICSADQIEERVIQEVRHLGRETLECWAGKVEEKLAEEVKHASEGVQQREKKR